MKAAELAAEMVGQWASEREGARELRVESPHEAVWDDIEVVHSAHVDRWQVKRLIQAFDREAAAEIILTASGLHDPSTRLHLGVASFVPVKKGKGKNSAAFGLHELAQLCQESRQPGLVPAVFEARERNSPPYQFVASALPGVNADVIVATLKRLWIHELGLEEKLRADAARHLHEIFLNPVALATQIHNWFIQNPDGAMAVDVDLLCKHVVDVHGRRDPRRPRWIHLARGTAKPEWELRGPLKLDDIVAGAWGASEQVCVKLGTPPFKGDSVSASLSRLVLHQSSRATSEAMDPAPWRIHWKHLCGGTLGMAGEAPDAAFGPLATTPTHPPRERVAEGALAARLAGLMNDAAWTGYVAAVTQHLNEDEIAADLRMAMKNVWAEWHDGLDPAPGRRASFLRSMLATVDEWKRAGFEVAVRAGRLRFEDLARSTVVALAIAAAFIDGKIPVSLGADGAIENLRFGTVPAHVLALTSASHPREQTPSRLCDAPGAMFERESGIAILGAVGESAQDLFTLACAETVPFHADTGAQSYLHAGDPFPLLTASPLLHAAMKRGLAAMRQYLAEALFRMNDERVKTLRQAVERGLTRG